MQFSRFSHWAFALFLLQSASVMAQNFSSDRLIDALKPATPSHQPATRSLRNLKVQAVPVEPPSVSLTIQFEFDSAKLDPNSLPQLKELAKAMMSPELQTLHFSVEGHTDAKGRADYNLKLSQRRANAVTMTLVDMGIPTERLKAFGKGSEELAVPSEPFADANRRVKIITRLN